MMKAGWLIVGLPHVAVPAWGQEVTISDLNGVTVQLSGVYQETVIRNGKTYNPKMHTAVWVTVQGDTIHSRTQSAALHPDGRKQLAPSRPASAARIGKPFKGNRGNDLVWLFSDGTLTRLAVHTKDGGAGGSKLTIKFKREPAGLSCSYSFPMVREVGVGEIRKDAVTDDKPIQILEFKQISSNCTVAKGR